MIYDLAIIGSGAAGIACAKQAIKYGIKTILFDKSKEAFGGTCLNCGCIPAKLFLASSKSNKNWQEILRQKNDTVECIKESSLNYLKKSGVEICLSEVSFVNEHILSARNEKIEVKNVIIATGSKPKSILNHPKSVFAQDLFFEENIGDNFLIVGAGYIGIEFSSLLNNLGKNLVLIEKQKNILPFIDESIANRLRIILGKKGIKIETSTDAKDYNLDSFDRVILSVGRDAGTKELGLEKIGLRLEKNGWIKTDSKMQTSIKNIYAVGDVTGKKLLAYAAEYQANICVDAIAGKPVEENYDGWPECVFSIPQIAKAGISEAEAKEKNIKYKILRTNFLKFSSAYVYGDMDGFMQILVDEGDRIMGAVIISNYAAELISIFSYAIKNNFKTETLQKCFFAHPTLSEIIPALLRESA